LRRNALGLARTDDGELYFVAYRTKRHIIGIQPSGAILFAAGGAKRRLSVGMILGARLGVVFGRQGQQAIMGDGIAGRVRKATASLGLLS
jgi:hypothetical protein